jgi:hypothetical protein
VGTRPYCQLHYYDPALYCEPNPARRAYAPRETRCAESAPPPQQPTNTARSRRQRIGETADKQRPSGRQKTRNIKN